MSSKNDFNEAKRLINDIRADTNNVKPSSNNKIFFNYLDKLINDISNNKKKESAIKRMTRSISDFEQLRQKESTVLENKMINVLYYLFNSFNLDKKLLHCYY